MTRMFGRKLELHLYDASGRAEVFRDHDMTAHVDLVSSADPNVATVEIWGLSAEQRGSISGSKYLEIHAGYGDDVGMIFRGSWEPAASIVRHSHDGPDWRTEIETYDGAKELHSSFFAKSYVEGVGLHRILKDLAAAMGLPVVIELARDYEFRQPAVFSGRAAAIFDDLAWAHKFDWAVQFGGLIITERGEPAKSAGTVAYLSATSGLVGAPEVSEDGIIVKTMLIPGLRPGGLIQIEDPTLETRIGALARITKGTERPLRSHAAGVYAVDSVTYFASNFGGEFGAEMVARYA